MECGVPFCHHGCPLGNLIPDWNDLVYRDRFRRGDRAAAPHEQLPGVHRPPLPRSVRGGVRARDRRGQRGDDQADRARDRRPRVGGGLDRRASRRATRSGRSVAVVGSGPSGLAGAQQLNRAGHAVTRVRARRGGRRPAPLRRARLQDREARRRAAARSSSPTRASSSASASTSASTSTPTSCARASTRSCSRRARACRATCPCPAASSTACTSRWSTSTGGTATSPARPSPRSAPAGKHVIVIGGGDTGADCVASAHREGAASVTQIELLGEPPLHRSDDTDAVAALADEAADVVRAEGGRRAQLRDLDHRPLRRRARRADPLAAEQRHAAVRRRCPAPRSRGRPSSCCSRWASSARRQQLLDALGVERDARGNIAAPAFATTVPGVFAAGDARRGQSLDRVGDRRGPPLRGSGRRVACARTAAVEPVARGARPMKPGPREGFRWTRETIIYAFELWHRRYLCSPTVAEWRRAGRDNPSATTVRSAFGSWNSAVEGGRPASAAAGRGPRRPARRSSRARAPEDGHALAAAARRRARCRRWAHEHGRPPTLEEWRRAGTRHPSAATVRRLFGSWNAALVAAGFEMRPPGVPVEPRSSTHARCEKTGRWTARPA